jgi:hypothetical protein
MNTDKGLDLQKLKTETLAEYPEQIIMGISIA